MCPLQFSYVFAIFIRVCNFNISSYCSHGDVCNSHSCLQFSYVFAILIIGSPYNADWNRQRREWKQSNCSFNENSSSLTGHTYLDRTPSILHINNNSLTISSLFKKRVFAVILVCWYPRCAIFYLTNLLATPTLLCSCRANNYGRVVQIPHLIQLIIRGSPGFFCHFKCRIFFCCEIGHSITAQPPSGVLLKLLILEQLFSPFHIPTSSWAKMAIVPFWLVCFMVGSLAVFNQNKCINHLLKQIKYCIHSTNWVICLLF